MEDQSKPLVDLINTLNKETEKLQKLMKSLYKPKKEIVECSKVIYYTTKILVQNELILKLNDLDHQPSKNTITPDKIRNDTSTQIHL